MDAPHAARPYTAASSATPSSGADEVAIQADAVTLSGGEAPGTVQHTKMLVFTDDDSALDSLDPFSSGGLIGSTNFGRSKAFYDAETATLNFVGSWNLAGSNVEVHEGLAEEFHQAW